MKLAVIDNYDSFTFNLVQYLGELGASCDVVRNDAVGVEEIGERGADAIVISPGPCTPKEAGISVESVRRYAGRLPILGVCLGHQSIAAAYGGRIVAARALMHGKTSMIHHDEQGIFRGLPQPFEATRYHSLAVERDSLPEELVVTASTDDGEIMGLRHRSLAVVGVQFHPESILTAEGKRLLAGFLALAEDA
ncbi:MAG: aminodeoxychorismate/anthranilate synthase component II [Proteobacteria bacterium]|nr:aminodeoxychorismate/anthranilate synthase component II [Pseudomonadota bacterium]